MHTTTHPAGQSEVSILARILGNDQDKLPPDMARYVLTLGFNDRANEFLLQQHWIRFDRPVVTSGGTEPSFGFRSDWIVGSDYRYTLPRGLFNGQNTAVPVLRRRPG